MNRKKLDKLKRELAGLRRGQHKAFDFQGLAKRLGRSKSKRGKEPMWESAIFPDLFPLAIPDHGGKDIPSGTQRSILDNLAEDILRFEDQLGDDDDQEGDDNNQDDEECGGENETG